LAAATLLAYAKTVSSFTAAQMAERTLHRRAQFAHPDSYPATTATDDCIQRYSTGRPLTTSEEPRRN
jgi:hypothetical protein